jgi:hypothetical protein
MKSSSIFSHHLHIYNTNSKGKWDALDGADMDKIPDALDKNDPNYDDFAEEGKYILSSTDGAQSTGDDNRVDDRIVYGPMLTKTEFKIRVGDVVKEYFDSGDADEVIRSIDEMKCKPYHPEVVKRAISLSLDKGPRERELVSRLLTCLHPYPLQDDEMSTGFGILLDSLEDLSIDIPDAKVSCYLQYLKCPCSSSVLYLFIANHDILFFQLLQTIVGSFLARAIVDEGKLPIEIHFDIIFHWLLYFRCC